MRVSRLIGCLTLASISEGFAIGNGRGGSNSNNGRRGRFLSGGGDSEGKSFDKTGLWAGYNRLLNKDPLLTKALTSGVGFLLGDILAQTFIEKKDALDLGRMLRFSLFGLLIHGPTGHLFYGKLDKLIPSTDILPVLSKVGIDQVVWNPIFGSIFLSFMTLSEGHGVEDAAQNVKDKLVTTVLGSWSIWPVAHFVNFKFIDPKYRILYINGVQIFYNMFLSIIAHRSTQDIPVPDIDIPKKAD
jgi:protein Mpv17